MSKSSELTSKIKIIIEIDDPGPGRKKLAEDLTGAKVVLRDLTIVQNKYSAAATSTGTSVRGLLLDLRMFSFGVRTLRREFGDTNPALEAMSQGLLVLAASGTMVISGMSLIRKVIGGVRSGYTQLAFQTVAFAAKTTLATISVTALAAGAAVLVGIPLLMWINDQVSGMAALRQQAKALAADMRMLDVEIETLTMSQERFNLGMSALSLQMMKLKQAIDLQQSGTEAMEAAYAVMSAEMVNARIQAAQTGVALQLLGIIEKEGAATAEDIARRKRAKQLTRYNIGGYEEELIFQAMKREGITEGRPSMQSMQAVAGGQTARGLGMASAPSITINFPNAQFNTEGDIEGAIMSGAEKAGRLLYNQYGLPGTQR